MATVAGVRALLSALLLIVLVALGVGPAAAAPGASIQSAPVAAERPAIVAPPGGWWTEDGLYARVHGAADDRVTVRRLADHAARAVPKLATRLGVPAGGALDIYVAPSREDFARIQPHAPPDWADGTAWPHLGLVFLKAPSARPGDASPLETVLDHEIVHVLLGRAFGARPVPRWLQEGMAQVYAGEVQPGTVEPLFVATLGGDVTVGRLAAGFRGNPAEARIAYAGAADLVSWLRGRYGDEALRTLVARMSAGADVEEALEAATGVPSTQVEAEWRARWSGPLPWFRALAREEAFWGGAALLFLLAGLKVRQRTRAKWARLEARERWEEEQRRRALMLDAPWSNLVN